MKFVLFYLYIIFLIKNNFKINIKKLKTIIYGCVCKYTNNDNYDYLYNDLWYLFNFYKYNKKMINYNHLL